MLSGEYGVSLPKGLVPTSATEVSKAEMQRRFKELWWHLDSRLVPKLRMQAKQEGFGTFADPRQATWEQVCLAVAQALYGEVLYHPILPNGQIPDFVPVLKGVRMKQAASGAVHVSFAPLIADAKFSMTSEREALKDYSPYCQRVEIWNLRWEPHRLAWRTPRIEYLTGYELAVALAQKGQSGLVALVRRLPLLWGEYPMADFYGHGIADFERCPSKIRLLGLPSFSWSRGM